MHLRFGMGMLSAPKLWVIWWSWDQGRGLSTHKRPLLETLPSPERDGGEQPGVSLPPALRFILIDTTGLKLPRRQAGSLGDVVCRRQMAAIQRGQRTPGKCPASPAMAAAVTQPQRNFSAFSVFSWHFCFRCPIYKVIELKLNRMETF